MLERYFPISAIRSVVLGGTDMDWEVVALLQQILFASLPVYEASVASETTQ